MVAATGADNIHIALENTVCVLKERRKGRWLNIYLTKDRHLGSANVSPISRRAMRSGVSSLRALIGNVTEPPGHISRMRRYDGMFRLPGAFSRREFSADYTINVFGLISDRDRSED